MTARELPVFAAGILKELDRLDGLVREASELRRKARRPPALENTLAQAALLHNFYTALEAVFVSIARDVDESVPSGERWHRQILEQMSLEVEGLRPAVLGRSDLGDLDEYLRFRHAFRHLYYFDLEPARVRALSGRLPRTWKRLRARIQALLDALPRPKAG